MPFKDMKTEDRTHTFLHPLKTQNDKKHAF